MKLLIQIPCLNEEATLGRTLDALPKSIRGIDTIERQIINDGSTDGTLSVARAHGIEHIISFKHRHGLAAAFKAGVENALALNVEILVNTDADSQYRGECIADLVRPIVEGKADIVVGARDIDGHKEFSWLKKKLQRLGSWVLRKASGASVEDAASGFRAYNRSALMRLNIFSNFSYTLETLIQAGHQNLKIMSVPIRVNPNTRESRLFRNIFHYLWNSGWTVVNVFLIYRSTFTFNFLSLVSFTAASALASRYLWLILVDHASRSAFWPSIIVAGCLFLLSIQFYLTGILAMLIGSNRKLLEEAITRLRVQSPSLPSVETNDKRDAA